MKYVYHRAVGTRCMGCNLVCMYVCMYLCMYVYAILRLIVDQSKEIYFENTFCIYVVYIHMNLLALG